MHLWYTFLLSARTAMLSMPVVLTEMENENDSVNQKDVAKRRCKNDVAMSHGDSCCTVIYSLCTIVFKISKCLV